ncbi:PAC2 family protein [Candidatus Poriferisocius sp.]|uniref:PAC2 family protein n=1 Tax=Candidatus Poriferisocius sp. TaxID=3101276 RepID=UPI003B010498
MITWVDESPRERPALVTAFTGWNDAGDAASGALAWLASRWETTEVATLDPEPFYDFADTRPRLRLEDDGARSLIWPSNDLIAATVTAAETPDGTEAELALLVGTEPQLKWRTFTQQIVNMAQRLDSPLVVTLGALLADVPHTRPTPIYGSSDDSEMAAQLGLTPSSYEGPTGIVGVLHNACAIAGLQTASLWAAVPGYASEIPSPKASLALVRRLGTLLDISPDTSELEEMAEGYERHVSELAEQADETSEYITQLESAYDQEAAENGEIEEMRSTDPGEFVDQIEQFLRNQRS